MQWFYAKDGRQLGPVSQEELIAMLQSGGLRQDDLVWREGMTQWLAASLVSELQEATALPVTAPDPNAPPPLFTSADPYRPPAALPPRSYVHVPNYLWQSIVVTIMCCPPFGIPAIVYATKVDTMLALGDVDGARRASDLAKTWCWIAFGIVAGYILLHLLIVVVGMIVGAAGAAAQSGAAQ